MSELCTYAVTIRILVIYFFIFCPTVRQIDRHTYKGGFRPVCVFLSNLPPPPRFHRGDVLVTTATGVMTEEEGEKWGLVPTHAYAVLDIRDHKVSMLALSNAVQD